MQNASQATRLSREDFFRNLCDSGLYPRDEINRTLADLLDAPGLPDADALAQRLITTGKLTAYQTEMVRARKFTELVIGNYEVLDWLGAGGMGTVFKARHRRMKRIVALKVLSRAAFQSDTFVQRFQREVEVISRLNHPHIVMAFDADEAEVGHFLVMEFVNGRDLNSEVRERGSLAVGEAVAALLQSARALEYAHAQGIIHRDIKPANLLRDTGGVVKVADLGLARVNDALGNSGNSGLTQAGGVVGTADYMPPEQAFDSTSINHRADIYSLGCTLYFLLAGRPPYQGESFMATFLKHREAPIPSLAAIRPDVPVALDAVFRKMVAKKPEDRYQTMTEVIGALEALDVVPAPAPVQPRPVAEPPSAQSTALFQAGLTTAGGPAKAEDSGATIDLTAAKPTPALGTAVLLVEPSRTQANIIRKFLTDLGTTNIQVAATGEKALEVLRTAQPRIVVSSMHLTDLTGVQLVQKVRAEPSLSDVGFILISSEPHGPEGQALQGLPHTVLLPKPFDLDGLAQALREAGATWVGLTVPVSSGPGAGE